MENIAKEEENIDMSQTNYEDKINFSINLINKLELIFEISDYNLDLIIKKYILKYTKDISDKLKKKDISYFEKGEATFNSMIKTTDKKKRNKIKGLGRFLFKFHKYFEFNFEDFLLIFLKILAFVTSAKIKLEIHNNSIHLIVFFTETQYKYIADYLNYKMQMKPYSKVYE